ncbi:MAG TPA: hypothetical protein PK747_05175 [Acidobacteriota bacterium]|nr:hypothetical protein [Acidobacteriota bacterium]HNT16601.1 hypothetical protein [Acidobacteriota bacterium]HPA26696.1 hypothetical protein [Acidobacteriota bacterium]HQO19946.1 hypothetical protein [Acidobacteriota bacterium]HQQ46785.1 hypothetical protein [Acidobacteriota bacterium]
MDLHLKASSMALPKALALSFQRKESGALIVQAGEIQKRIYLDGGSVIFATSNDRNDRLGEMLIRRGVISVQDFLLASSRVGPGKRFGTILIEMGLLTPEQLVWAVKEQVKEIIFSLFGELFISYRFEGGAQAGNEVITLNINTPELIRQGILSMDRISWVLADFEKQQGYMTLTKPPESLMGILSLSKTETDLLFSLKKGGAFPSLFSSHPINIHASILKFLWALYILGYVEIGEKPDENLIQELDVTGEDLGI